LKIEKKYWIEKKNILRIIVKKREKILKDGTKIILDIEKNIMPSIETKY